jgi:hypothetical protein
MMIVKSFVLTFLTTSISLSTVSWAFVPAFARPGESSLALTRLHLSADTPAILPEFSSQQDYIDYLESASSLPQGFATGSADGTFISVEAPNMGELKIRGTIIALTDGPTDNWAAVFTSNKVSNEMR